MKTLMKNSLFIGLGALLGFASTANADTTGNRYGYPVLYKSDISSAAAWELINKGGRPKPIILDVRRVTEYAAGHPKGAYSVPFPHVIGSPTGPNQETASYIGYDITVDPEVGFIANIDGNDGQRSIQSFVDYVSSIIPDKSTPILVLCATGHRSVQASNALAKYGYFTNVRNIWEGYNGQPKYAYALTGQPSVTISGNPPTAQFIQLDLNNDGVLNGNDRDGWAFFQKLPTETTIKIDKIDQRFIGLYPQ